MEKETVGEDAVGIQSHFGHGSEEKKICASAGN
jgi:hypothetical protein